MADTYTKTPIVNQRKPAWVQILALVLAIVPYYGVTFYIQVTNKGPVPPWTMTKYISISGCTGIIIILLVMNYLCKERVAAFNLKPGKWWVDIIYGIALYAALFIFFMVCAPILARLFPGMALPEMMVPLFNEMAVNPLLLLLWVGPIIWISVGIFEELSRTFILNRLWIVWPGKLGRWVVILIQMMIVTLVHTYHGPPGTVLVAGMCIIFGAFYLWRGRIWPMIIAHALYDTTQFTLAIMVVKQGGTL